MSCAPTELWVAAEPQRGDGMDRQMVSTSDVCGFINMNSGVFLGFFKNSIEIFTEFRKKLYFCIEFVIDTI